MSFVFASQFIEKNHLYDWPVDWLIWLWTCAIVRNVRCDVKPPLPLSHRTPQINSMQKSIDLVLVTLSLFRSPSARLARTTYSHDELNFKFKIKWQPFEKRKTAYGQTYGLFVILTKAHWISDGRSTQQQQQHRNSWPNEHAQPKNIPKIILMVQRFDDCILILSLSCGSLIGIKSRGSRFVNWRWVEMCALGAMFPFKVFDK